MNLKKTVLMTGTVALAFLLALPGATAASDFILPEKVDKLGELAPAYKTGVGFCFGWKCGQTNTKTGDTFTETTTYTTTQTQTCGGSGNIIIQNGNNNSVNICNQGQNSTSGGGGSDLDVFSGEGGPSFDSPLRREIPLLP